METTIYYPDGRVEVAAAPFDASARGRLLAQLGAVYEAKLAWGFPVDFSEDGSDPQTLQLRTAEDKANWLTLMGAAEQALSAGLGDELATLPIRCTSNAMRLVTWRRAAEIMVALRAWGAAMMGRYWALKDAIEQAADADLGAIDIEAGWP